MTRYRVLFDHFGIMAMRPERSDVSLYIVSFWRTVVVAFSPRGRWIDIVYGSRSRLDGVDRPQKAAKR